MENAEDRYRFSFENSDHIPVDIDAARIGTTVVPVIFVSNSESPEIQGSAFCVAKFPTGEALFITAKHVIEPLIDDSTIRACILLPAGPVAEDGMRTLIAADVISITVVDSHNDIALLVIDANDHRYNLISLPVTFGPPQVGQPCMALGYPQKVGQNIYEMRASVGKIEEIHPRRRDSVLANFPSFRTDGLYPPGMSGGPIVDMRGRVIGVISIGTEATSRSDVTGYGSAIGIIIEMRVSLCDYDGERKEVPVTQLADAGYLGNVKDETVTLHRSDDGVALSWNPSPN